jgi:hypothetical protein
MLTHPLVDGTLGARARRRLQESEYFDDLVLLGECDRAGRVPGNYVRPSELTKPERTRLADALHAIDLFAAATRAEITGRLLG